MKSEKRQLIESYRSLLETMLSEAVRAMNEAQEEANNHVGAMESRYDTFKEEAQYLASAHKARIAELQQYIEAIDYICKKPPSLQQVEAGCLVYVSSDDEQIHYQYLILPGGDGGKHRLDKKDTFVVSPGSPVARQLLGKSLQDDIMVIAQGVAIEGFIVSIS